MAEAHTRYYNAPAGLCVHVGKHVGGPVGGAAAGRESLPEVLHILHAGASQLCGCVCVDDVTCHAT